MVDLSIAAMFPLGCWISATAHFLISPVFLSSCARRMQEKITTIVFDVKNQKGLIILKRLQAISKSDNSTRGLLYNTRNKNV